MNKKGKKVLFGSLAVAILLLAVFVVARPTKPECYDKIDNDGDGLVDLADGGCTNRKDTDESNCGDGVCEGGENYGSCPNDCAPPDSCSDSDGGDYPQTAGTTSGYLNGNTYNNNDYCVDSNNINEYYCSGDYELSQQENCGTDSYSADYCNGDDVYKDFTDYYCTNGACNSNVTPEFVQNCGTDGYSSNYCMNGSVVRDYNDYFCTTGTCDHISTPEVIQNCDYGCTNGVCDSIPDSCTDTDYGFDPNTFGIVIGYSNEVQYNYTDYCVYNSTMVMEYYCSGSQWDSYVYECNTGNSTTYCMGGTCI